MFWTPAFAGVTTHETFYEFINISSTEKRLSLSCFLTMNLFSEFSVVKFLQYDTKIQEEILWRIL